ncbi:MAG: PilW family protein [Burkholderiales bacterium]
MKARGFSLVEIMVGLVIALLATIVIFQVFAVSEGQKRTTTSGSDAQQSGSYALYLLERELRVAGASLLSTNNLLGCQVTAFSGATPLLPNAPQPLTPAPPNPIRAIPVLITDGGGGNSDSITVLSGTSSGLATPVSFRAVAGPNPPNQIQVESVVGFNSSDLILAVEQEAAFGPLPAPCTVAQVSNPAAAAPAAISDPIEHDASASFPFNNSLGLLRAYSASAMLVSLGPNPTMTVFAVQNNALAAFDLLQRAPGGANPIVLANDVVNIQAQYGIDNAPAGAGDDVIDAWVEPTAPWNAAALTPLQIGQIKAIRIGLVIRSPLLERPDTSGNCTTTTNAPRALPAVASAVPAKPAAPTMPFVPASDGCYRYRIYETVIPVRNMIWSEI